MNTNWDEIRGKAEREQNVPTKTFTHDGTQYALTGDHQRAHSHFHEARAHMGQLKRINVNNLPIISGIKYFDDGSVAMFKVVHGKEDIHIVSPIAQLGGEIPPVPKKGVDEVEQIVPVFRSIDNTHWVACLSGTFEPPYYHFPNTFEIPAEALDDNIETDLDKQFISIGITLIEDGIDLPELYFVAQTGGRPSAAEIEWKYYVDANEPYYRELSFSEKQAYYVFSGTCCEGGYEYIGGPGFKACYSMAPPQHSFTKEHHQEFEVFGQVAALPNSESSESGTTTSVHAGGCSDVWGDCETAIGFAMADYTQAKDLVAWGSSYPGVANSEITSFTRGIGLLGDDGRSIRVERDNVDNVASCYSIAEATETHTHTASVSGGCVFTANVGEDVYTTKHSYSYCFRVDDDIFFLRGPTTEQYPYYSQGFDNQVKYYNTDSIASVTGMMSAVLAEFDSPEGWLEYNYVGPNSGGTIATPVRFYAEVNDDAYTHIIPNVEGIDDTVLFRGEIFLGLIKYEIEA